MDCSGIRPTTEWGIKVNGSYWNITNLVVANAPNQAIVFQLGGYNYLYNVLTRNGKESGIVITNKGHNNFINYCKSENNYDSSSNPILDGEMADGFACKFRAGANNRFEGCVATGNSDDGWDLYDQDSTVTINNCKAEKNGKGRAGDGNGFKLGSPKYPNVPHTVTNCRANSNMAWGYDGNGNLGIITFTNSTGTGNKAGLYTRMNIRR